MLFLDKDDKALDKAEFTTLTEVTEITDLPVPVHQHCMVKINEDEILLIGGKQSNQTWHFSIRMENWEPGPDMPEARSYHKCAFFSIDQDKFVAVSPGSSGSTVQFLKLTAEEESEWIAGPSLPEEYSYFGHQMVSYGNTLIYINTFKNEFLKLKCQDQIIQNCSWIKMSQRLMHQRRFAMVSLIPDDLTDCE